VDPGSASSVTDPAVDEAEGRGPETSPKGRQIGVLGASLLFLAVCLGFLLNTPSGLGPDELFHLDRVVAAAHGDLVPEPGQIHMSKGVRGIERTFTVSLMRRGGPSWAEFTALARDDRPSLEELGGNARSSERDWPNYMAQHPPAYYALMGGLVALTPNADDIPGDALYLLVRVFNILLILPLPLVFAMTARQLVGDSPIASAAAFLPLLVPGLARGAATVNNDNLAILIGAIVIALSVRVMRGDASMRTALALAGLAVLGSLTKATVLTTRVVIVIAYTTLAVRRRSLPGWRVASVLVVGAACAAVWWVRNLLIYGGMTPEAAAWGAEHGRATGEVRAADVPMDMDRFWSVVALFPSRLIASLGLHEPPRLPTLLVWIVTAAIVVSFPVALVVLRGRRWELVVLFTIPLIQLFMVLLTAYNHYRHYLGLPGIQGRYAYPALFGLVFPVSVATATVLGRARRWTPLVVALGGLIVSGWALYVSVEYTWLVRGTALVPSNWLQAFKALGSFFPLAASWTVGLALGVASTLTAGLVLTIRACLVQDRSNARTLADATAS
jgi:hypothetical protein